MIKNVNRCSCCTQISTNTVSVKSRNLEWYGLDCLQHWFESHCQSLWQGTTSYNYHSMWHIYRHIVTSATLLLFDMHKITWKRHTWDFKSLPVFFDARGEPSTQDWGKSSTVILTRFTWRWHSCCWGVASWTWRRPCKPWSSGEPRSCP